MSKGRIEAKFAHEASSNLDTRTVEPPDMNLAEDRPQVISCCRGSLRATSSHRPTPPQPQSLHVGRCEQACKLFSARDQQDGNIVQQVPVIILQPKVNGRSALLHVRVHLSIRYI